LRENYSTLDGILLAKTSMYPLDVEASLMLYRQKMVEMDVEQISNKINKEIP